MKGRKYRPSNGTEGAYFTDKFCMQCIHCDPNPSGKKQCQILCNSMVYDVEDKEYPKEWVYDENNKPSCTKWKKWDWGNDGDPDDENNPKAPAPPVPKNQLVIPFILEEIGQPETLELSENKVSK